MAAYADLEIGLHRWDAEGGYSVELRASQPGHDADVRLVRGGVRFDVERLRAQALDVEAYGRLLGEELFAEPDLWATFRQACANAQTLDVPLRLRLFVGPSAPELHGLRWETLRDPRDGTGLLTGEHVLFSRYLSSVEWRPAGLRPRAELSALVVIANPSNVADYQPGGRALAPVDVAGELARVTDGLGNIRMTALTSGGSATLNNLAAHLRDGYDILYLVCHGALIQAEPRLAPVGDPGDGNGTAARPREPRLWLEDESGRAAIVPGRDLVARLRELRERPRLVVLASCQSGGSGATAASHDEGALAALGPRLAEDGVPAVLAMQGNVSMQTVAEFMPVFFRELERDGQIDRAMAVARGAVRGRADAWMPVLFLRLKSGRIWYVPGFGDDPQAFEKWPALLRSIRQGQCTPILGSGLVEPLLGSSREIAQHWAEAYHFPMAPHNRENLPQVAQYLAVHQDPRFPYDQLEEHLRQQVLRRYGGDLPDEVRSGTLDQLLEAVVAQRRAREAAEPHDLLARLPFPLYVTTNLDNLLDKALVEAGKEPQVELCRWNEAVQLLPSIYDQQADYRPDPRRPLVYDLFGRTQQPDSLVLTEDDYFDYLIGVTTNKDLIPGVVRRALANTALLFLGFQLDDWNFRVLFRSLMSQEGRSLRNRYAHVAVQIDPEEGRILEPERARRYLQGYFQDAKINIYWGSAEDFVKELWRRWTEDSAAGKRP